MEKDKQLDIEQFVPTARELGLLDQRGREIPDPTPMAPPLGYVRQPSLAERIRDMVAHQIWLQGEAGKAETFEEANDLDEDDEEFSSPYEYDEDAELERLIETKKRQQEEAQKRANSLETSQGKKPPKGGVPPTKEPSEAPEGGSEAS